MAYSMKDLLANMSDDVRALNPHVQDEIGTRIPNRKNKYNARKTEVDGIVFDSKKEAARYSVLKTLNEIGIIQSLQLQVRYKLADAFEEADGTKHRAIHYTADFVYGKDGVMYIEDVKSKATQRTEGFRLRWKMLCKKFADDPSVRCVIYD